MKNKRVKQMMAHVFSGEWKNNNSNGSGHYGNGMSMWVHCGWLGENPVSSPLSKKSSLTANQLKGNC